MKARIYFGLFLLCACLGNLSAQRFRAGFSGGLIASDIAGAHTRAKARFHKVGFTAGLLGNVQIAKKAVFQFEINYMQKGSLQPPDSLNMGYYKIALQYVEIPLIFKRQIYINYKGKSVNKVDIEGGLSYGRLLHTTVIGSTNYSLPTAGDYFNKNIVNLVLGVDYNFTKNVYFCFRYCNSLSPAVKRNALKPGFYSQTFNNGNNLALEFSFKFAFGGSGGSGANNSTLPSSEPTLPGK